MGLRKLTTTEKLNPMMSAMPTRVVVCMGKKKYHTRYLLADNLFATHLTYRVLEAELLN